VILISRIVAAVICGLFGYQLGANTDLGHRVPNYAEAAVRYGVLILLGLVLGWVLGGLLGKILQRRLRGVRERFAARSGSEVVVMAVGLIVGLAISALLSLPVAQLDPIGPYLMLPMTLIIAYVAAETAAAKHRDILRLFGVRAESDGARSKLLDTSALIDGRIATVSKSGFLEGDLVVPVFVLEELQHIADSSDDRRRARGRRGLEIVTGLRKARRLVTIDDDPREIPAVDGKLVKLAASNGWAIVTTDVNLARVAEAQSVPVLNVNELANALKPEFVPGEQFDVKVVREGKEAGQGVGYLDDGTMVIVDQGRDSMGETIAVEVSSMLQSPTGKLVFARTLQSIGANGAAAKDQRT
jgi:uncharacterized protein YacL